MLRQKSKANPQPTAVVFRSPRNWTAVVFFGALGSLHLSMALTSYTSYQAVLHMSLVFGTLFIGIAVGFLLARHEITFQPERRRIVVRTGIGRLAFQRCLLFSKVVSVRVTLLGRHQGESSVSVISAHDEIELPPTPTPRQEALLLAIMMGVRLVKVYCDGAPAEPAERIARLYRNEDAI
jgi:hypothetical protein